MEEEIEIHKELSEVVIDYAKNAELAGLDGVVCSPLEAGKIHEACGKHFATVTPGIRFADSKTDDQVRITTPARAREIGSDCIVSCADHHYPGGRPGCGVSAVRRRVRGVSDAGAYTFYSICDGTLTDSGPGIMKASQLALHAYGVERLTGRSLTFLSGRRLTRRSVSLCRKRISRARLTGSPRVLP